jgi:hypothetical protein
MPKKPLPKKKKVKKPKPTTRKFPPPEKGKPDYIQPDDAAISKG